jgi:hypothetical protein
VQIDSTPPPPPPGHLAHPPLSTDSPAEPPLLPFVLCVHCSTLKAIRMQETSKGRKLTAQERQDLMRSPLKLLQTLLGPLGVLYSGLKPAAIETVASQAVSGTALACVPM